MAQELILLAHFTKDPFLINVYKNKQDFYTMVASKMFNKDVSECGDGTVYRTRAKTIVLSLLYGKATFTLAKDLGIDKEEAELLVEEFFNNFTNVKQWMDNNLKFCKENGYVEMLYGRKRRLPNITSSDWKLYGRAERQGKANAIIQGSASIQTKLVMIALDKWCNTYSNSTRKFALISSIHDEVLVKVPKDVTFAEMRRLEDIMINTLPLDVPSKTDIELSNNWGKLKNIKNIFPEWRVTNG